MEKEKKHYRRISVAIRSDLISRVNIETNKYIHSEERIVYCVVFLTDNIFAFKNLQILFFITNFQRAFKNLFYLLYSNSEFTSFRSCSYECIIVAGGRGLWVGCAPGSDLPLGRVCPGSDLPLGRVCPGVGCAPGRICPWVVCPGVRCAPWVECAPGPTSGVDGLFSG